MNWYFTLLLVELNFQKVPGGEVREGHDFVHIVTKMVKIPNHLLLFLCIFQILASLHIICIPSLLVFQMSNFTLKICGRKSKKTMCQAGEKFQNLFNYIHPCFFYICFIFKNLVIFSFKWGWFCLYFLKNHEKVLIFLYHPPPWIRGVYSRMDF